MSDITQYREVMGVAYSWNKQVVNIGVYGDLYIRENRGPKQRYVQHEANKPYLHVPH